MKLLVISYKVCWAAPEEERGFVSYAGFPFQMNALSQLFSETRLMLLERRTPPPSGTVPLTGQGLQVTPLPEPKGSDLARKIRLLTWLPLQLPRIWRAVAQADAVHALVPGDLGTLGLLIALAQRKPLFVRHCGTWGDKSTAANRFLAWLLPRVAGGRVAVMATGGGDAPPEGSPESSWIFSTTLSKTELDSIPQGDPWTPPTPLHLVTVGRLSPAKNARAVLEALPEIDRTFPGTRLAIVGDGPEEEPLKRRAEELGVADRVTFHGNVAHERVLEILQGSHLFLFPTRVAEGFPKAVLEAMACGLPALVPPVSVLPMLVRQGGGRLLSGTEAADVAKAVVDLAGQPEAFAKLAGGARKVAEGFTLERWRDTIGERLRAAWGRPLSNRPLSNRPLGSAKAGEEALS